MTYTRIFTDDEIDRIYQGGVRVLLKTGFCVKERRILERLEKRGARVDYARQVFWPMREMIRALEACATRNANRPPPEDVLRRPPSGGERLNKNVTLYYDWQAGTQRPALLQDERNLFKICHALPEVVQVGQLMTARDVPPRIEPIVSLAEAIRTTDKPETDIEVILAGQIQFLEELHTIKQGKQVRYRRDYSSVNRLTIDERSTGVLMDVWGRNGLESWGINSCPIAGATAPVTVAGAVALTVAETLGGWFVGWALNEDVRLNSTPASAVLDMHTARALYSAPEAVMIDCGHFQVLDRVLGVQTGVLADYCDGKVPGLQAVHDKVFKGMTYWLLTGQVGRRMGNVQAGKAVSPTQMMIDFELNRELERLARGAAVTEETLALDVIEEYGMDFGLTYLGADHTYRNFRTSIWHPQLMDRSAWSSPEQERKKEQQMLLAAEAKWRDALARYEAPDIPEETIRAVDAVVERARQALL